MVAEAALAELEADEIALDLGNFTRAFGRLARRPKYICAIWKLTETFYFGRLARAKNTFALYGNEQKRYIGALQGAQSDSSEYDLL